jgi:hypothetical protein
MNPFEKLLVDLAAANVRFVTVGGVACALNGYVRATQDVDILVSAVPANLARMLDVLKGFGDGHAAELTVADFPVEPGAIRIIEEFPLDIFTVMMDYRFEDLANHVRWFRSGATEIPFLDAAGLVLLKGGSHRPQDRIDVDVLMRLPSGAGEDGSSR